MAKPVEFLAAALAEADAAAAWYAARSPRAAEAFRTELERAIERVAASPARWRRSAHGTRRVPVNGFPFVVVYRDRPARIEVVAVAHGARRPAYWRRRRSV